MKRDSMHSTIKLAQQKTPIHMQMYVSTQWDNIMHMGTLYNTVVPLKHVCIFDLSQTKTLKVKKFHKYSKWHEGNLNKASEFDQ